MTGFTQLNRALDRNDPIKFQIALLDIAHGQYSATAIAKYTGFRRETIWRYRQGKLSAPLDCILKLSEMIGARVTIAAAPPKKKTRREPA